MQRGSAVFKLLKTLQSFANYPQLALKSLTDKTFLQVRAEERGCLLVATPEFLDVLSVGQVGARAHPAMEHGLVSRDLTNFARLRQDALVLGNDFCVLVFGGEKDVRSCQGLCVLGVEKARCWLARGR